MRLRPFIIGGLLVGAGIAVAVFLQRRLESKSAVSVLQVPAGDSEIAWFHTSTSGASWEHFVAAIHHACRDMPDVVVDDSQAFLERTTAIPEVVISWQDHPSKLRFRWYKQASDTTARNWIDALAARDPPPLAIIGGGSSDRALDLALALNDRTEWKGQRPLLLMTTATAVEVDVNVSDGIAKRGPLSKVYPERSFRFCFSNAQMARAVVDFVWAMPDLRPRGGPEASLPPTIFPVYWQDDPYSVDLSEEFRRAINTKTSGRHVQPFAEGFPYSVGAFDRPTHAEAEYAERVLDEIPTGAGQRSLLIVPTATTPARRFIHALTGESPLLGKHLVAVNGDAISINDVYRDGSLLWNVRDVPVPLVFFAHQDPIGWDEELPPPAGTDEVLLFAKIATVLVDAAHPHDGPFVSDAEQLHARIRAQTTVPFDDDGNRKDGEEYIVCVRPEISDAGRIHENASLEVWHRSRKGSGWEKVEKQGLLRAPYAARRRVGL